MPFTMMPEITIQEVDLNHEPQHVHLNDEVVLYDEMPSEDEVMEIYDENPEGDWIEMEEPSEEFEFDLPKFPGAPEDVQDVLEVEDSAVEIEVEQPKNIWDVEKYPNLADWLRERCAEGNIPSHRAGKDADDVHKIRRTISYLKKVLKHASDMVAGDFDRKVDVDAVGPMLTKLEDSIERLQDLESELEGKKKKKKKAAAGNDLVKEGQKAPHVGGIIVTVPLLISRIARVCINGTVSAGHDIEDLFLRQAKMYNLTDREKAEVIQLIEDMNYPVRRDRIRELNDNSPEPSNGDWLENFKG